MTIGSNTLRSLLAEYPTIERFVPDAFVTMVDTTQAIFEYMRDAEARVLATANDFAMLHNAGAALPEDYTNYAKFRRRVFDTQVVTSAAIRSLVFVMPGGSVLAAQIPAPTMLREITPASSRNLPTQQGVVGGAALQGLGAAPAAPFVLVFGAIAIIAAGVLLYFTIDALIAPFREWMLLDAQRGAIAVAVNARKEAFSACLASGQSAQVCAVTVAQAIPAPTQAAINDLVTRDPPTTNSRGFVWYAGATLIGVTLLGTVWYGWREGWFKQKGA